MTRLQRMHAIRNMLKPMIPFGTRTNPTIISRANVHAFIVSVARILKEQQT